MNPDLDTLLTALYVKTDDYLIETRQGRRRPGRPGRLTDAELVTLAVAQALLGYDSETRWLRYAYVHLRTMFRYLPKQPDYNKRLILAGRRHPLRRCPAAETTGRHTKVAGQNPCLQMWSGHEPRYSTAKTQDRRQSLGTEGALV